MIKIQNNSPITNDVLIQGLVKQGKEAGYIEPIRYSKHDKGYRAVSVHGRLDHTYTLEGAKQFVIENYG